MNPSTVSELYPSRWLKAADLNNRTITVEIKTVTLEELHNPRTNSKELHAVLGFGRSKDLIANKTQCLDLADIVGSEAFSDWVGQRITLTPARAHNGKATIRILPPPHEPEPEPAPEPQPEPEPEPTAETAPVVTAAPTAAAAPITTIDPDLSSEEMFDQL